ncbi:ribosomal protein S18-alanine N-acetyltransferase [Streptomyces sp. 1222.5]|uniref:ribosomal protein S18-alanine N-acetyltransferase n=1 Tax=Streptomyces sp. 1222.5 TaxID=1881026 RepID=UPI003D74D249
MAAQLREMRWWDIEPVLKLDRELFPRGWTRDMFWYELARSRGPAASSYYLVAEAGGRHVGYAGIASRGYAFPPGQAHIQIIAVAADQQGAGLGGQLLTALLRAATEFGCQEVVLECRVDNGPAHKLYERFGFATTGVIRGHYISGQVDAQVMLLNIPSIMI